MTLFCFLFLFQDETVVTVPKSSIPEIKVTGRELFAESSPLDFQMGKTLGNYAVLRVKDKREVIEVGDQVGQEKWLVQAIGSEFILLKTPQGSMLLSRVNGETRLESIEENPMLPSWLLDPNSQLVLEKERQ